MPLAKPGGLFFLTRARAAGPLMEKRTEHLSFCTTPEIAAQLRAIAAIRDLSPSALMAELAAAECAREHDHYLVLSQVFGDAPDIADRSTRASGDAGDAP